MRAARVTAFGPVEDIKVAEVERPVPASGQVLVRIAAAGVNFADTGMVRGTARRSEPPFSPGVEAAGVIEEANGAAADLVPGTRVVYWDPVPAAFAEYAVVDGWGVIRREYRYRTVSDTADTIVRHIDLLGAELRNDHGIGSWAYEAAHAFQCYP